MFGVLPERGADRGGPTSCLLFPGFDGEERMMKKTYKIDVDCANCAAKMEEAAKGTPGVKDAVVNFMTLKMKVEFEDGADIDKVMDEVEKNCKIVEDDCQIFR